MKKVTTKGPIDYRFGEFGPAYLLRQENLELGVVALRPGDEVDNHYHEKCDESFICIEGSATVWINQTEEVQMTKGDVITSPPGEQHFLRNNSDSLCRFIFIKTPASPGDTINVAWSPEN